MKRYLFKLVALCLTVSMFVVGMAPGLEAGLVPSQMISSGQGETADLEKIKEVLETKMVRERLAQLGFTEDETASRLSQLTAPQIHQLALNLDEIKTGGDGLGIVIALLVIAILAVLLIQLTGHRIIVK